MRMTPRFFRLLFTPLCLALADPPAASAWSITAVGEVSRAATPTGLSGLTYAGGTLYYAVNDSGALIYPMSIGINLGTGSITSNISGAGVTLSGADLEGIAYNPAGNSVWVSDETGATIKEYSTSGSLRGTVPVPANQLAYRGNFSLEALTVRGDGLEMWTSNEEALSNSVYSVNDGPLSSKSAGSVVRLTRFIRPDVQAAWTASGQWAYLTDPIEGDPYQNSQRSGAADLCVLPDGTLLVLEREMSVKTFFPTFRARIYAVTFTGATEVSGITSLNGASYAKVAKTRLFDANTFFSNYEGLCLGPRLNDGSLSLVMIADGDDSADETLYALKLSGLDVRTLNVTSSDGTACPAGGPWRYVSGQTVTAAVTEPFPDASQRMACTGWILTGHTPGSGTGVTCTFAITNDAQLTWNWASEQAADLPVKESFESYPAGVLMDGVYGWVGNGEVNELAYAAPTPPGVPLPETSHTKVLRCDGDVTRTVAGGQEQNVNVDAMLQACRAEQPDDLGSTVQTAFCVDTNGLLQAWHLYYDGLAWTRRWTILSDVPIMTDQWVRVSVSMDYSSSPTGDTFFRPRLNGSLCPTPYGCRAPDDLRPPGSWYLCADSPGQGGGGAKRMSAFSVRGQGLLDDLVISTESFAHTGAAATNDVPFAWFDAWGVGRNPYIDSDGDGFAEAQEYTAGTDPTDPESVFRVVATWVAGGYVFVRFLGNDSGDPAPYVMERATDLAIGDWTVVDDEIPRVAAPQTLNTWSERVSQQGPFFYRPKAVPTP